MRKLWSTLFSSLFYIFPVTKAAIVARSSRQIGLVNLRGMKQLMRLVDFAPEI